MPEIIEWLDQSGQQIVWRHPRDRLQWGDNLTVKPNQVAVFMQEGKVYDVFTPGNYVLKTDNIPYLSRVLSAIKGYDKNPFHAEVIFVSTADFRAKFGGRSQTKELAPLQFYGDYIYHVTDPVKFAMEIVGNRNLFSQNSFEEFFKSFFQEQLISSLSDFSIVDVMKESTKTSKDVEKLVDKDLKNFGIGVKNVNFAGLDTTPEYRDRLFWMRSGVDVNQIQTFSAMKDVAGALPSDSAAGLGATAFLMPEMMRKADQIKSGAAKPEEVMIKCNQCSAMFSPAAKFCPSCGDPTDDELKGKEKFCVNCGNHVSAEAKFCGSCGAKL